MSQLGSAHFQPFAWLACPSENIYYHLLKGTAHENQRKLFTEGTVFTNTVLYRVNIAKSVHSCNVRTIVQKIVRFKMSFKPGN
jgi:hypothetical protein